MGRYLGPREKIERRAGEKLFLKGERSHASKSAFTKRPYPPGQHGPGRRPSRTSEYGQQVRAKQRIRSTYRLLEKQFKNTVFRALSYSGSPHEAIVGALESRLDNIVFRVGFAQSRDQARQLVNHGHITVNGKRVSIPSYTVRVGETIGIREASRKLPYFTSQMPQWLQKYQAPKWISLNQTGPSAIVNSAPDTRESGVKVEDVQAVIEYYSR